jgi:hypothetical protein
VVLYYTSTYIQYIRRRIGRRINLNL